MLLFRVFITGPDIYYIESSGAGRVLADIRPGSVTVY